MIHGRRVESPVARFLAHELLIALQSCEDPSVAFNMVLKNLRATANHGELIKIPKKETRFKRCFRQKKRGRVTV